MNAQAGEAFDFRLNPRAEILVQRVGAEALPVIVIDQALLHPEHLVAFAAEHGRFEAANSAYPGLTAEAPLNYVSALVNVLRPTIEPVFGLSGVAPSRAQCNFSLATLRPDELALGQRMPHVDTVDPLQFAVVHYLFEAALGGTAFYRHRSTGFESLSPEREPGYLETLARETDEAPPPAAYVSGDTELFAQTAAVEARFNRVLVYHSRQLHSGSIPPGAQLSSDPRRGRLTANIFLNFARLAPR